MPKLQDVLFESFNFLHLSGLQVAFDVLPVDLVDSQLAEVYFGAIECFLPILSVDIPQSIVSKFGITHAVLISLIENSVENLLCLDFCR